MFPRKLLVATTTVVVAALALTACSGAGASGGGGEQTLTLAPTVENDTFDPAQLSGGQKDNYWQAVYDTPLSRNVETMELEPNLATEWEWNDAGTVLTMKLRDDVKFTDGTSLNADAVAQNALILRDANASSSFMMADVTDAKAVDEFTVEYTLDEPNPAFLGYLATIGGAIGNPTKIGTPEIETVPAGSGPYVYDEAGSIPGSTYIFTRNPEYWNTEKYPYDKIVLNPIVEQSARLNAVRSGQVNGSIFDSTVVAEAEGAGLGVDRQTTDWQGLFLSDRQGTVTPALADVRVRQAINHAIDGDAILESVLGGEGVPTTQVFNPGDIGFVEELDERYPFDPAKAKSLLAEAGYADGFDLAMPQFDFGSPAQPIVVQQLGEVGIRVQIQPLAPADYNPTVKGPNFAAYWMNLTSGDPWRNAAKLFPVGSTWNSFDVDDATLNGLMKEAAAVSASDPDKYAEIMAEISTYAVDNALMAVWFRPNSIYVNDKSYTAKLNPYATVPELKDIRPAA